MDRRSFIGAVIGTIGSLPFIGVAGPVIGDPDLFASVGDLFQTRGVSWKCLVELANGERFIMPRPEIKRIERGFLFAFPQLKIHKDVEIKCLHLLDSKNRPVAKHVDQLPVFKNNTLSVNWPVGIGV